MRRNFFSLLLCTFGFLLKAQTQDTATFFRISGYIDSYYAMFTDSMGPRSLQQVTTVSPRNRQIGINIAQLGVHYSAGKVRGNLVLHYGDIVLATWSAVFSPVQAANAGFRLAKGWWIDVGFFRTHIGTESFLPKNDFLSSTAVATYNEPFYQAGARLTYEASEKFDAELWLLNGYNQFVDINSPQSVGLLLRYNLSSKTSLTYTNLLGIESPDAAPRKQFRSYHNMYFSTSFQEKIFLVMGGDFGTQSNSHLEDPTATAAMYNALATLRYQFKPKFSVSIRGEVFQDPDGFISGIYINRRNLEQGLQLWGVTLGAEYRPVPNAYIRPELRYLKTEKKLDIFSNSFDPTARWEAMITMGFYFDKLIRETAN